MSSLAEEVRRTFDLASLRKEASAKYTADEWRTYQEVRRDHAAQRRDLQEEFERDYPSRFEKARQKLIDDAGSKPLDLIPKWLSRDRFDKSAIERQARMSVLRDHRQDVAVVDKGELKALGEIKKTAEQRQALHQMPTRDFQRATDRRSEPDRRIRQR